MTQDSANKKTGFDGRGGTNDSTPAGEEASKAPRRESGTEENWVMKGSDSSFVGRTDSDASAGPSEKSPGSDRRSEIDGQSSNSGRDRDESPMRDSPSHTSERSTPTSSDNTGLHTSTRDNTRPTDSTDDMMGAAMAAGNYGSAVTSAYKSVYEEVTDSLEIEQNLTHWDLVDWCEHSDLRSDQVEAVRTVVEAYDTAAFSSEPLRDQRAEVAIRHARSLDIDSP